MTEALILSDPKRIAELFKQHLEKRSRLWEENNRQKDARVFGVDPCDEHEVNSGREILGVEPLLWAL